MRKTRMHLVRCSMLVALSLMSMVFYARADDYALDPAPKEIILGNAEEYEVPKDHEVCSLYLKNLRYFTQRQEPLSCDQPIAPILEKQIQRVEWENLDPKRYPVLFMEVFKQTRALGREPTEKELNESRLEVARGGVVFRRVRVNLKGFPAFSDTAKGSAKETEFAIVQYGINVTDPKNPQAAWRCRDERPRRMDIVDQQALGLFVVTRALNQVYYMLTDGKGNSGQDLWLINGRIYGELYDENGDVKLSELRTGGHVVNLEPVCLYHYMQN